jgi:hypothetical protein
MICRCNSLFLAQGIACEERLIPAGLRCLTRLKIRWEKLVFPVNAPEQGKNGVRGGESGSQVTAPSTSRCQAPELRNRPQTLLRERPILIPR